jgi:hypothetical protein
MATCVIFDCESDDAVKRAGDRNAWDFAYMRVTCACAAVVPIDALRLPCGASTDDAHSHAERVVQSAEWHTFWCDETSHKGFSPFEGLLQRFDQASIIVAYNGLHFDFPLLRRCYTSQRGATARYVSHRAKCFDIFERVRAASTHWPSLNELLRDNALTQKTGDGARAVQLWRDQQRDELAEYCRMDVELTLRLGLLPWIVCRGARLPNTVHSLRMAATASAAVATAATADS